MTSLRNPISTLIVAVIFLTASLSSVVNAQQISAVAVDTHPYMPIHDTRPMETLHIPVGQSIALQITGSLQRVYIGNPLVLQSFTSGPSEVLLTGKSSGISSFVVWNSSGQSHLYTVDVDLDPAELSETLQTAYPSSQIQVSGKEGRIYLSGAVATQEIMDGAFKLALTYTKDVMNGLHVVPVHGKQVQLKLRIVEVDRTRMEQYGFNIFAGGKVPFSTSTGQFNVTNPVTAGSTGSAVSDPLNLFLYSQAYNVGVTVKDLEQKQILQVLAEPTLTTLSGETARFLSGGEFPFPVVQGGTGTAAAITIMFRPYGVKVEFTPTVNADGSIRLKVAPEVSTLDFANAVSISGFTIPALSTRRAETEVEIRSGQSFAVSGLLDHRTTESLSHIPGIASIPIIGQLFRSKAYTHSVVELVVLVTATVVDPLTDTASPVEPKFAVPNMENEKFDHLVGKIQKINPKQ